MKLQYMGTAAAEGFPALFCECDTCKRARERGGKNLRLRSGILINDTAMIDLCPDVMTFSQRFGIRLSAVRDLFITHSHSDHFDVEDLAMRRNPVFCQLPDDRPMNVHLNAMSKQRLDEYIRYEHVGYEGYLNVDVLEYFQPVTAENGLIFTHLPAEHAHDEHAGIYVITDGEKTAVYVHDTGVYLEDATMEHLRSLSIDFLSLDCCYGPNLHNYDRGHMGIPQNRQLVQTLREAKALQPDAVVVINHFTHNCGMLHEELEKEVEQDGFIVSYDGMIVEI